VKRLHATASTIGLDPHIRRDGNENVKSWPRTKNHRDDEKRSFDEVQKTHRRLHAKVDQPPRQGKGNPGDPLGRPWRGPSGLQIASRGDFLAALT